MSIYLGIDYGRKHLGLALADGPLARPLTSLDMEPSSALSHIVKLATDNGVQSIVIGLPEGLLDTEVRQFGESLHQLTGCPVFYHPETLSTHDALDALRKSGASRAKKANDHVYAACLILEDYLEAQNI